jgi:sugar transferase (PEP-CTERM/EpsH1 system associated)
MSAAEPPQGANSTPAGGSAAAKPQAWGDHTSAEVDPRLLVMHVVHAFDVGGLENGVANLINNMPRTRYRHVIVALTEISSFRNRIRGSDVAFVALNKRPGHGARLYPAFYRLMRRMKPAIVHTRNLAALEMMIPACVAGVPVRIHGEHGRDIGDLDGSSRRHQWMRRAYRPFVNHYVALSRDLARYLTGRIGVPASRISQIYNGVDTQRFAPGDARGILADGPFNDPDLFVFGSVGRMVEVKNPVLLARAFVKLRELEPRTTHTRLIMAGEGPLRQAARDVIAAAGLESAVWMPGSRDDVPALLRSVDCFVLPSLAEGISNTILEAMASALPVIATDVGGNGELVRDGVTGTLVSADDPVAMATAMLDVMRDPLAARLAGGAGRSRAVAEFSLDGMVGRYQALYDALLQSTQTRTPGSVSSHRASREY